MRKQSARGWTLCLRVIQAGINSFRLKRVDFWTHGHLPFDKCTRLLRNSTLTCILLNTCSHSCSSDATSACLKLLMHLKSTFNLLFLWRCLKLMNSLSFLTLKILSLSQLKNKQLPLNWLKNTLISTRLWSTKVYLIWSVNAHTLKTKMKLTLIISKLTARHQTKMIIKNKTTRLPAF